MLNGGSHGNRHSVPVEHLEYSYIDKCDNIKELEKILRVLRSGDEGVYPHLEKHCEDKIAALNPSSRILRKEAPVSTARDLDSSEWQQLSEDLSSWSSDMKSMEDSLKSGSGDTDLPPVRGTSATIHFGENKNKTEAAPKADKRVKPRDYKEWDKVNVDEELAKIDQEEAEKKQNRVSQTQQTKPELPADISSQGAMTDMEKNLKCEREKDKGNEAYRAGDYPEAVQYYSRSLSLIPTAAAYNNRALAHLKLENWDKAIKDCNQVLKMEPENLKAYLRRGTSYKGKKEYTKAKSDLTYVLKREPRNKLAQKTLNEVEKSLEEQKVKGRRMVITEVEGSSDEEEEEEDSSSNSREQEIKAKKMVNGERENSKGSSDTKTTAAASGAAGSVPGADAVSQDGNQKDIWTADDVAPAGTGGKNTAASNRSSDVEINNSFEGKTGEKCDSGRETQGKHDEKQGSGDNVEKQETVRQETAAVPDADSRDQTDSTAAAGPCDAAPVKSVRPEAARKSAETNPAPETVPAEPHGISPPAPPPPLPPGGAVLKDKGTGLYKSGQYAEAIEKYTSAIEVVEADEQDHSMNLSVLYSNRAACKSKIGDCPGCIQDCTQALSLLPGAVKPLLRRAAAYEMIERYDKAYIDFRQALGIDNSLTAAHQGSTRCSQMLQQRHGSRWREKLPSMPAVPVMFAAPTAASVPKPSSEPRPSEQKQAKLTSKQREEKFTKSKAQGNKCVQAGQYDQAILHYAECIDAMPDQAVAYTNRALCYLKINKPQLAFGDCSVALGLDSKNVKALFRRAQANKEMKKYTDSLNDLKKLLQVDPKNTAARKEQLAVQLLVKQEEQQAAAKSKRRVLIEEESSSEEEPETAAHSEESNIKEDRRNEPVTSNVNVPPVATPTEPKVKLKVEETSEIKKQAARAENKGNTVEATLAAKTSNKSSKVKQNHKQVNPSPVLQPESVPSSGGPHPTKATPYEFMTAWNALKKVKDTAPYAELLLQVAPQELPHVISNKLEGDMLSKIMAIMNDSLISKGEYTKVYQYLSHLVKVPRFQMVAMFMSGDDKKVLSQVFSQLRENIPPDGAYSSDQLTKLQKDFS